MGDKRHLVPTRSRRQFPNRRTPNRSWTGTSSTGPVAVAAATKVVLATFVLSNPNIDETILRTVGVLAVQSDQAAASEDQIGALGMIVVNDLALAAGAASIPGPITDIGDDGWFLYVPFAQRLNFSSAVGVNPDFAQLYQFDSKAKRRVEEGSGVALIVENASSGHAFNVELVFRQLSQITGT